MNYCTPSAKSPVITPVMGVTPAIDMMPCNGIGAAAPAPAGAPPLPCQDSDNFTELKPYHRKCIHALKLNVESLCDKNGIERIGFLTLTYGDHVKDLKDAQRRFKSLQTHCLKKLFKDWIVVIEFMGNGRVHYHLLLVCGENILTGFNFEEVKRKNYRSAGQYLRGLWKILRKDLPRYGFGRHELKPIRTCGKAVASYVAKYFSKGLANRLPEHKGMRLVRYSRGWRVANCQFAWASPRAGLWRGKLAEFAKRRGIKSFQGFQDRFGPKWAYKLKDRVMSIRLSKYDLAWLAVADGQLPESYLQSHGGEIPDDAIINFKNDRYQ